MGGLYPLDHEHLWQALAPSRQAAEQALKTVSLFVQRGVGAADI
jgi:hypothetical protein